MGSERKLVSVLLGALLIFGTRCLGDTSPNITMAGYNLFRAGPGTTFEDVGFKGVPIGHYDFGTVDPQTGNIPAFVGDVSTGDASVILRHGVNSKNAYSNLPADDPGVVTDATFVGMTLRSTGAADFGAGSAIHFLTLAPDQPSGLLFNRNAGGETELAAVDFNVPIRYELRRSSVDGLLVRSGEVNLVLGLDDFRVGADGLWIDDPSDDAGMTGAPMGHPLTIDWVNIDPDPYGFDSFWPQTPLTLHGDNLTLVLDNAAPATGAIPLPSPLWLTGAGLAALAISLTAYRSGRP